MNELTVFSHLREAHEELGRTIKNLESDPEYDTPEFGVGMSHLYHHLNTAWNAQAADDQRYKEGRQEDFDTWRKFPSDSELFLDT